MTRDGRNEDRPAAAHEIRPVVSDKSARVQVDQVRFARAATRHRVSKESIRSVIAKCRLTFEEPPRRAAPRDAARLGSCTSERTTPVAC